MSATSDSFDFLDDDQLSTSARLAGLRLNDGDISACLLHVGRFIERMANLLREELRYPQIKYETLDALLDRLAPRLPDSVNDHFNFTKKLRNKGVHYHPNLRDARDALTSARELAIWFQQEYEKKPGQTASSRNRTTSQGNQNFSQDQPDDFQRERQSSANATAFSPDEPQLRGRESISKPLQRTFILGLFSLMIVFGVMLFAKLPNSPPDAAVPKGNPSKLSPGEIGAFRTRVSRCWTPPAGIDATTRMYVVLRVLLAPNGSLASDPVLVEGPASALGPALAESAKRALRLCQPFTMFKPEHYDQSKDLELKFDPHELLGG